MYHSSYLNNSQNYVKHSVYPLHVICILCMSYVHFILQILHVCIYTHIVTHTHTYIFVCVYIFYYIFQTKEKCIYRLDERAEVKHIYPYTSKP